MNTSLEHYTRLARDLFGMSSLWKGPDHLVYVKGSGFLLPFTEDYKRFHYSEIQSLSLVRTSRLGIAILFGILIVVFGGAAALFLGLPENVTFGIAVTASVFVVGALAAVALLVRHLILGPTCICDIQTAVSKERLRPLNRLHRTRHAIEMIEVLIQQSQKELIAREESSDGESGVFRREGIEIFSVGKITVATFLLFTVLGGVTLAALHFANLFLTASILFLIFAGSLLLILSLISSVRKPTPDPVRVPLWGLLGTLFVFIGCGAVYFLVAATQNPAYTIGLVGPVEAYTSIATDGGVVVYSIFMGLTLAFLLWSVSGLFQSARWTRRIEKAGGTAGS